MLGGLTLLDTIQNYDISMLPQHIDSYQNKAMITYMAFIEGIRLN